VTLPASPGPQAAHAPSPPAIAARGLCCVILDSPSLGDLPLAEYLQADGIDAQTVSTLPEARAALAALAASDRADVVLVCAADAVEAAMAALSEARSLAGVVALGRAAAQPPADARVVAVDAMPMRRKTLRHAIVAAAGGGLPAAQPPASAPAPAAPVAPSIEQARSRRELILVVEDDEINRKVITRQLELLGRTAEVACDGEQALAMLLPGRHALLLTDLHMPRLDGYQLAAEIRRREADRGDGTRLPIVALTASALLEEQHRASASGMDAYLAKPAPLDQLRALIDRWLPPIAGETQAEASAVGADAARAPRHGSIDIGALKRLIGADDAAVHEFLGFFLRSEVPLFEELVQASARGDLPAAGSVVHRLRSSALTVGAATLGARFAALEQYCRGAPADTPAAQASQALQAHLAICQPEFEAACAAMREAIATPSAGPTAGAATQAARAAGP
jgi:CheY-like chemotaxis protein/HPt (histidine-containing phosphotransfer) domain-containing protein